MNYFRGRALEPEKPPILRVLNRGTPLKYRVGGKGSGVLLPGL